jgi:hypothetical protein
MLKWLIFRSDLYKNSVAHFVVPHTKGLKIVDGRRPCARHRPTGRRRRVAPGEPHLRTPTAERAGRRRRHALGCSARRAGRSSAGCRCCAGSSRFAPTGSRPADGESPPVGTSRRTPATARRTIRRARSLRLGDPFQSCYTLSRESVVPDPGRIPHAFRPYVCEADALLVARLVRTALELDVPVRHFGIYSPSLTEIFSLHWHSERRRSSAPSPRHEPPSRSSLAELVSQRPYP